MQEKYTAKHTLPIDSEYQFKELPIECIRWTRFSFAGTTFIAMSSNIMRQICTYTRHKSTSLAVTYSKQWNFFVSFRFVIKHNMFARTHGFNLHWLNKIENHGEKEREKRHYFIVSPQLKTRLKSRWNEQKVQTLKKSPHRRSSMIDIRNEL